MAKRSIWRKITIALCIVLAVVFALGGSFFLYVSDYYRADEKALKVEAQDDVKRIEEGYLLSSSKNKDTAIIFYPGAKVEFTSYLPLMDALRDEGITCYLVEMPFNLAFFGSNIADTVIESNPDVENWYVAGHSLGGAMASSYASANPDKVAGLLLYGAYPSGDYPLEKTLTVYGSLNTSVADKVDYTENVVVIDGGNHAQFGNYGAQKGDADATISAARQQSLAAQATKSFILDKQ